jgi:tetratricopeptide (TPR) repeat protein
VRNSSLEHHKGVDVFLDKRTGEKVYMGRLKDDQGMTSAEDFYERGKELVNPYILLVDVPHENPNTEQGRRDISQGIEYLQIVTKLHPEHWPTYWYLGKVFEALRDAKRAYENFKKAYEIKPDEVVVCRELMNSCLELGKAGEGVSVAQAAVQLEPKDAGLWANLGLALLLDAQLPRAKQATEKALELDPSDSITRSLLRMISLVQSGRRPQPRKMSDLTG